MFQMLWADMWTPEKATGWRWAALFGGHVFVGCVIASGILAYTSMNPYLIDVIAFFGYLFLKESFDYLRSRDWRDAVIDAIGVGFGAYILTSVALDNFHAAFSTGIMALLVAIYGYMMTLREAHERDSGIT